MTTLEQNRQETTLEQNRQEIQTNFWDKVFVPSNFFYKRMKSNYKILKAYILVYIMNWESNV